LSKFNQERSRVGIVVILGYPPYITGGVGFWGKVETGLGDQIDHFIGGRK